MLDRKLIADIASKIEDFIWPNEEYEYTTLLRNLWLKHLIVKKRIFLETAKTENEKLFSKLFSSLPLEFLLGVYDKEVGGLRLSLPNLSLHDWAPLFGWNQVPSLRLRIPPQKNRKNQKFYLPRLGIGLPLVWSELVLEKQKLTVFQENGRTIFSLKDKIEDHFRLPTVVGKTLLNGVLGLPERDSILQDPPTKDIETFSSGVFLLRKTWPQAWDFFQKNYTGVVLCKHSPEAVFSFTHGNYPRILFTSARDPIQVADAIVHESSHARLGHLLQFDPLIIDDHRAVHFSPWRQDPRPLSGILNGVHAFLNVRHFYQRLLKKAPVPNQQGRSFIVQTQTKKIEMAWSYLESKTQFTQIGNAFKKELNQIL